MSLEQAVSEAAAPVLFTDAAARQIKSVLANEPDAQGKHLRIGIRGGGCSGFTYALDLDEPRESDGRHEHNGVAYLLDPVSARYLAGTLIDYTSGLRGAGFEFRNPNATHSCGCGHSFTTQ